MKNIRLERLQLLDKATTHTLPCQMSPGQEARASSPQGHRSTPAPATAMGGKGGAVKTPLSPGFYDFLLEGLRSSKRTSGDGQQGTTRCR